MNGSPPVQDLAPAFNNIASKQDITELSPARADISSLTSTPPGEGLEEQKFSEMAAEGAGPILETDESPSSQSLSAWDVVSGHLSDSDQIRAIYRRLKEDRGPSPLRRLDKALRMKDSDERAFLETHYSTDLHGPRLMANPMLSDAVERDITRGNLRGFKPGQENNHVFNQVLSLAIDDCATGKGTSLVGPLFRGTMLLKFGRSWALVDDSDFFTSYRCQPRLITRNGVPRMLSLGDVAHTEHDGFAGRFCGRAAWSGTTVFTAQVPVRCPEMKGVLWVLGIMLCAGKGKRVEWCSDFQIPALMMDAVSGSDFAHAIRAAVGVVTSFSTEDEKRSALLLSACQVAVAVRQSSSRGAMYITPDRRLFDETPEKRTLTSCQPTPPLYPPRVEDQFKPGGGASPEASAEWGKLKQRYDVIDGSVRVTGPDEGHTTKRVFPTDEKRMSYFVTGPSPMCWWARVGTDLFSRKGGPTLQLGLFKEMVTAIHCLTSWRCLEGGRCLEESVLNMADYALRDFQATLHRGEKSLLRSVMQGTWTHHVRSVRGTGRGEGVEDAFVGLDPRIGIRVRADTYVPTWSCANIFPASDISACLGFLPVGIPYSRPTSVAAYGFGRFFEIGEGTYVNTDQVTFRWTDGVASACLNAYWVGPLPHRGQNCTQSILPASPWRGVKTHVGSTSALENLPLQQLAPMREWRSRHPFGQATVLEMKDEPVWACSFRF